MKLINVISVLFYSFVFHANADYANETLEEKKKKINLEDVLNPVEDIFDIKANGIRYCSVKSNSCTLSFTCPISKNCSYDLVKCKGECY